MRMDAKRNALYSPKAFLASSISLLILYFASFSANTVANTPTHTPSTNDTTKHAVRGLSLESLNNKSLKSLPLAQDCFTQGFYIHQHTLYLSCGRYNHSKILAYAIERDEDQQIKSLKLKHQQRVPEQYFAEGLSLFDKQLVLLTWKSRHVFLHDPETLQASGFIKKAFKSGMGQAWGVSNDEQELFISNGSSSLQVFDNPSFTPLKRTLEVSYQGQTLSQLNELELIGDHIWANLWKRSDIALIDKNNGQVKTLIDLSPITKQHQQHGVLNGIAYDVLTGHIWATGKYWGKAYKIGHMQETEH